MTLFQRFCLIMILVLSFGCAATKHPVFPDCDPASTQSEILYDVNGNGVPDFALRADDSNHLSLLAYDDDEDGRYDRIYNINDYATENVPHLIIILDSVPYQCVLDKYSAGSFPWFPPPQKVIAPFPSLTDISFNRLVHAPPPRRHQQPVLRSSYSSYVHFIHGSDAGSQTGVGILHRLFHVFFHHGAWVHETP